MYIINFIRGFCMALADSVPGVSGGTIAFLLGFYDKFIGSLDAVVAGKKEEKIEGLRFLIKIGIGWITGFVLSMLFLGSIFEAQIYNISSLFLGFIIFAIPIIVTEEKKVRSGEWDVKIDDPIPYFDADLSYELTGYKPITATKGLDFNPEWFVESRRTYERTGHYC